METIGDRIRKRRVQLKLSQDAVGTAMGVTGAAVSKLESGGSAAPASTNLKPLADILQTTTDWILYGGQQLEQNVAEYEIGKGKRYGNVPLISWVIAGELCDSADPFPPGAAEDWLPCPVAHGPNTFALKLNGLSMWPDYRDGEIIFVDPDVAAEHGSDVVVRTPDNKTTFKRLQITPEGKYLLAINPDFPDRIIRIPDDTQVCGVAIFSGIPRRK